MKSNHGFTLIELLVVISIIGLLSSVVLAALSGARNNAKIIASQEFAMANYRGLGDRLLFWYNFNDSTSGSTVDLSGNNMTGTFVGSPTRSSSSYSPSAGSALPLNGTSQKISMPTITVPIGTGGLTLSAWVLTTSTGYVPILTESGSEFEFAIGGDASCVVSAYENYTGNVLDGVASVCDGKWHNITFTTGNKGGVGMQKIYIDGKLDNTSGPLALFNPSLPFSINNTIGYDNGGGWVPGAYAAMTIDDVMEFSASLPLSEIQRIYAEGAAKHGIALK